MVFYSMEKDERYPSVWYNENVDPFTSIICPKHKGHQSAIRDENVNLSVEVKKKKIGDFVATVYSDWLITDKVVELFEKHNFTGYALRPVDVCNMKLSFNLWELVISGKADYNPDCGIKELYRCDFCGTIRRRHFSNNTGIMINESSWDGSDFCIIESYPTKFIFTIEKVKNIIEEQRLTGVLFMPSTELRRRTLRYDEDFTKEQWKEYFERDVTPLQEELEKNAREMRERAGWK